MMTYDVDGRNHTVGTNVGVSDPYPPPIVDGDWGAWGPWGGCSKTCLTAADYEGPGTQTRERSCDEPAPGPRGEDCSGEPVQTRDCSSHPDVDGFKTYLRFA